MITVLMPTYNCAEYLPYSINSILNQSFEDFEFLIIDDGSTDNSEEVIARYKDARIRYVKKANSGLGNSLNYGLRAATSDIILRMDADDIANKFLLEKQFKLYMGSPTKSWIGTNYTVFNDSNMKLMFRVTNPIDSSEIRNKMSLHSYVSHPGSIMNRKVILELGGFKNILAFEDYEFFLRVIDKLHFTNNQDFLLYVRYRNDSLSRKDLLKKNNLIYQIQEPYYAENFQKRFLISNINEEYRIRGWREYFYGQKYKALVYWTKSFKIFLKEYRVVLAIIIMILPTEIFLKFKEIRLRYRLLWYYKKIKSKNFNKDLFLNDFINK